MLGDLRATGTDGETTSVIFFFYGLVKTQFYAISKIKSTFVTITAND